MRVSFLLLFFGMSYNFLLLFCLEGSGLFEFDGNIPELIKDSKEFKELGKTTESEEYGFEFDLPHIERNHLQNG